MKSIMPEEYYLIKDEPDVYSVDVRTKNEVKSLKSMSWATNIELSDLQSNYETYFPDKQQRIVTICNAGNRSGEAARFLESRGYENATVLYGGIYGYFRKYK